MPDRHERLPLRHPSLGGRRTFFFDDPQFFRYRPFLFFIGEQRPSFRADILVGSSVGS
jgi:hypothetical protein